MRFQVLLNLTQCCSFTLCHLLLWRIFYISCLCLSVSFTMLHLENIICTPSTEIISASLNKSYTFDVGSSTSNTFDLNFISFCNFRRQLSSSMEKEETHLWRDRQALGAANINTTPRFPTIAQQVPAKSSSRAKKEGSRQREARSWTLARDADDSWDLPK